MDPAFARIGDSLIETITVRIPNVGPWDADVRFVEAPGLSGQVTIQLGADTLVGTVVPSEDGTFGLQRQCEILAGAGTWGTVLASKHYHNDAGVKSQLIAADAARESGETLGTFVPAAERVGLDYVRQQAPASIALLDAIGGNPWWVDAAGLTQVGLRPSVPVDEAAYEVLAFNPRTRRGTLAIDAFSAVGIGSIITARLDQPQTIRELTITINAEGLRAHFWSGAVADAQASELALVIANIIQSQLSKRLLGKYQYRVVQMRGDGRVDVQAVRRAAGLPDQQTITMWPGTAGTFAKLAPGSLVLLEFIEGDRTQPIITGFVGPNGPGFVPVEITIGGTSGPKAARIGDTVALPINVTFQAVISGSTVTGTVTSWGGKGSIDSGSAIVHIAGASGA